ncbi:hypothetical protein AB2M62_11435 [Sphingomonas sp. MMS12-HWE2-04]|uniref:hypothetical protein n=1 Tax=Sphingomonas sp. MMS12-HWE2-04 TaxID=3234199 RepID=UPI00384A7406
MSEPKSGEQTKAVARKSAPAGAHPSTPSQGKGTRDPRATSGRLGRAIDHVSAHPLTAVAGAMAVSAGIAFLLPTTKRETEVMGEVADTLGDVARDAADGVVAAGRAQVEGLAQTALAGVGGAVLQAVTANGDTNVG